MDGPEPRSLPDAVLPFVLRVGVTGHRDPITTAAVRKMVTSAVSRVMVIMEEIMTGSLDPSNGGTTPIEIRVVSSLAEGADRIVVNSVFDATKVRPWWTSRLAATIPYDIAHFREHDCRTEESREDFDRLLRFDPSPRTLQHAIPHDDEQRDRWYRDVGRHVVDRCDLLMALWDGTDNNKPAGTAATVKRALDEGTPVVWIPTTRASGEAAVAPTGVNRVEPTLIMRLSPSDQPTQTSYSLERTSPKRLRKHLVKYFKKVRRRSDFIERLNCLQKYNRHALNAHNHPAKSVEEASPAPSSEEFVSDMASLEEQVSRWIVPKRVMADELAHWYQSWFRCLDVAVYGLTVVAVSLGAVSLGAGPLGIRGWWVWGLVGIEFFALLIVFVVVIFDGRRKAHDRWVGFRAVAEYFRSSQFVCYVALNTLRTPSDPMPLVEGTLARARIVPWFAPVIEDVWENRPEHRMPDADVSMVGNILLEGWVDDQKSWHEKESRRHACWHTFYRWAIRITFVLSFIMVAVHLVLSIYGWRHPAHWLDTRDAVVAVIVIALASTGAALNSLAAHANHGGHAERYKEVAYELGQQREEIKSAKTFDDLRHRIIKVRRIMLGETSLWFEGMYTSAIEVPT